jgi:hypothetical protein
MNGIGVSDITPNASRHPSRKPYSPKCELTVPTLATILPSNSIRGLLYGPARIVGFGLSASGEYSRQALEKYRQTIRHYVRNRHGVYAL